MLTNFMKNRIVIAAAALCAGFLLAYLVLPQPDSAYPDIDIVVNDPDDADIVADALPADIPDHLQEPKDGVHFMVEEMPTLVGGLATIIEQMKYPEIARKAGIEGRVFLQFVVNEEGNVQDVVVQRGIGAGCDEEAVRVVSNAKFTPGMQDGEPVKVRMSLPVTFKLAQT